MQSRIANTIAVMFDSIWNDAPPISVAYVSHGSKLKDVCVYIKPEREIDEEKIMTILNKNSDNIGSMTQTVFRLDVIVG